VTVASTAVGWRRRAGVAVLAVVAVVGLFVAYGFVRRTLTLRAIDRHERRWEQDGPKDYRYHVEVLCFCVGPRAFDVTVEDGRVTATDPVPRVDALSPPTIEELFDTARDAVRGGATKVQVEFDDRDGHITTLDIDEARGVADDEVAYTVRDFEATGGDD
jgi:hypothetical protein